MKNFNVVFVLISLFVFGCSDNRNVIHLDPKTTVIRKVSNDNKVSDNAIVKVDNSPIVEKFKNYLNNLKDIKGEFVQKTSDGKVENGYFLISKPGKMKIEYDNGMILLADGENLIYYDSESDQITTLDLKDSPAAILLLNDVKLDGSDAKVVYVSSKDDYKLLETNIKQNALNVYISFKVKENPFSLEGWILKDAQDITTDFSMKNVKVVSGGFDKSDFELKRHKTYGTGGVKSQNDFY